MISRTNAFVLVSLLFWSFYNSPSAAEQIIYQKIVQFLPVSLHTGSSLHTETVLALWRCYASEIKCYGNKRYAWLPKAPQSFSWGHLQCDYSEMWDELIQRPEPNLKVAPRSPLFNIATPQQFFTNSANWWVGVCLEQECHPAPVFTSQQPKLWD